MCVAHVSRQSKKTPSILTDSYYFHIFICHTIDFRSRMELPQVSGYIFLSPDPLSTTLTTDWNGQMTRPIVRTSLLRITLWRMRIMHHP